MPITEGIPLLLRQSSYSRLGFRAYCRSQSPYSDSSPSSRGNAHRPRQSNLFLVAHLGQRQPQKHSSLHRRLSLRIRPIRVQGVVRPSLKRSQRQGAVPIQRYEVDEITPVNNLLLFLPRRLRFHLPQHINLTTRTLLIHFWMIPTFVRNPLVLLPFQLLPLVLLASLLDEDSRI